MNHTELKSEFPAVIYLHYSVTGQYTFSFSACIYIFNDIINKEFVVQGMVSYCRLTDPQNLLLLMLNSDQRIIQQYNRIRTTLCFLQFYVIYCCCKFIWWGRGTECTLMTYLHSRNHVPSSNDSLVIIRFKEKSPWCFFSLKNT